jgi:hypothetical protein
MALTRDQILEANDLKTEEVQVPEWGGSVKIRTMTGADRNAFEASMVTTSPDGTRKADMSNLKAKLCAVTIVGDDGNLLFSADEVGRLAMKSAAALERVFDAAQALNALGAKAEDEAAKN